MKYCISVINNLKEIREVKQYSQLELADLAGTTANTIEKIESGEFEPPLLLCLELAKILEVRVENIWKLAKAKC